MKTNWKTMMLSCVVLSAPTVMAKEQVKSGQAVPVDEVVLVNKTTTEPTLDGDENCNIAGGFLIGNGCSILGNIEGNISNDEVVNNIL